MVGCATAGAAPGASWPCDVPATAAAQSMAASAAQCMIRFAEEWRLISKGIGFLWSACRRAASGAPHRQFVDLRIHKQVE